MDLPGKDVNLFTQRSANEWTDVVISCLDELNINIKNMEGEINKQYIIDSVSHIKRYYQQLEQELVKTNVTPQDDIQQSNIKLRF